jgi:RHS repeat-associated protein
VLPLPTTWLFDPETFAPASKIVGDKYYSIITDHLGTPLSMYDETGVQTWGAELDIYGIVKNLQGEQSDCPFRFPGQYEDGEIGLYYNRFRYYDATSGEYVSQDPIRLSGSNPNLYGYGFDVNVQVDLLGLTIQWVNPSDINFTQRTVSAVTSDGIPLKDLTASMEKHGFDLSKGAPLNVMVVDGQLVSYDNRRLLAAQNANLDRVPIVIVDPDSVHPDSTTGKTWRDKFKERRNHKKNKQAGGVVPEKGLKEKPKTCGK